MNGPEDQHAVDRDAAGPPIHAEGPVGVAVVEDLVGGVVMSVCGFVQRSANFIRTVMAMTMSTR